MELGWLFYSCLDLGQDGQAPASLSHCILVTLEKGVCPWAERNSAAVAILVEVSSTPSKCCKGASEGGSGQIWADTVKK